MINNTDYIYYLSVLLFIFVVDNLSKQKNDI